MRITSTGTDTATTIRTNPPTTAPAITATLPPLLLLPEEVPEPPASEDDDDDVVVGLLGPMTGLLTLTPGYPALLNEVVIAAMVAELLRLAVNVAESVIVVLTAV